MHFLLSQETHPLQYSLPLSSPKSRTSSPLLERIAVLASLETSCTQTFTPFSPILQSAEVLTPPPDSSKQQFNTQWPLLRKIYKSLNTLLRGRRDRSRFLTTLTGRTLPSQLKEKRGRNNTSIIRNKHRML